MKKLLLTIPCYNEEQVLDKNIRIILSYLENNCKDYDWHLQILDNASTDKTFVIATALKSENPRIMIDQCSEKGRGRALKNVWSRHRGYDLYAYMDADLATDLKHFPELLKKINDGADIAIGSRYVAGADIDRSPKREILSRIYNGLLRAMFGVSFFDAQCGFKIFNAAAINRILPLTDDHGWFWDTESLILAEQNNFRISEVPVSWREVRDADRKSKVSPFLEVIRQLKNIIRLWFRQIDKKWLLGLVIIMAIFLSIGIPQIYHQDEHRWAMTVDGSDPSPGPHPPITRWLLGITGRLIGFNYLRVLPSLFGILNLILVYAVSKELSKNKKIALIAASLFVFNAYSLIASLQIDIDGAILPFFVLLTMWAYLKLLQGFNKKWLLILALALVGGLLTKLSFVLCVGAIIIDYLFVLIKDRDIRWKALMRRFTPWILGAVALLAIFYYFYATHLDVVISYAEHFKSLNFSSRAYLELIFKILKSFMLASPVLLLIVGGLIKKEVRDRYRVWFLYLLINLIFYTVLFDFTNLTVERYFMFLIVPMCLIGAEVIHWLGSKISRISKSDTLIILGIIIATAAILNSKTQALPLNPKSAYLNHVRSLDLKFLIPFTGGSGPVGFYFSAEFIIFSWIASAILLLVFIKYKKQAALLGVISVFIIYNALFIGEYLAGATYGSVPKVAKAAIEYSIQNKNLKDITTYYDIGAYELKKSGKYGGRFYTAPNRDYTDRLTTSRGGYMIVDFPEIDKASLYWKLISRCPVIKKVDDKMVHAYIFDCSKLP